MKSNEREATVVVAKCTHSKQAFGIRMEKKNEVWHCTWAFKINEKSAKNEGYDTAMVSGRVEMDAEYPGCPYCGTMGWFSCGSCGNLTCYSGETNVVTCAWCGNQGECQEADTFDLKGGGY